MHSNEFVMRKFLLYLFLILSTLGFNACSHHDDPIPEPPTAYKRTLFVYMPWASNLYSAFEQNLKDLMTAINSTGLDNQRIIIFLANSNKTATLQEVVLYNGFYSRKNIKDYSFTMADYTTVSGLTSILADLVTIAPADEYSMIIGCHGMGWLPVTRSALAPSTRWFGGASSLYQTEISTLHQALSNANIKLEYLLFDDCYMATAEVAYELKDVIKYLIASTCEIMNYGMPYHKMGKYLLGKPDYENICASFFTFYNSYSYPYGTISVTSTSQLPALAQAMKDLNDSYSFDPSYLESIQDLDGFTPTIFFDFGSYVKYLTAVNPDAAGTCLYRLDLAVPYKSNTPQYYSQFIRRGIDLAEYSGLTISDPSTHDDTKSKDQTSWWYATH